MDKYKEAVGYAKNILGNKIIALKMLDQAEILKQVSTDYKLTNVVNKSNLVPPLTADRLFGNTHDERKKLFGQIIS